MREVPQKIPLVFYRTKADNEPVREWLLQIDEASRKEIGQDLQRVQYRWPVGMPLVRPLGSGLFEVRTDLPGKRIARVLCCFHDGEIYALHGFIKKTEQIPPADLALAKRRKKDVENG